MSEAGMRQRVVKILRPLDAVSIENSVGIGTPDINYREGWVELKWLRSWPKKDSTIVRLAHDLTKEQRVWLRRRASYGGNVWVLLQCRREWLLFYGEMAAHIIGTCTKRELIDCSRKYWPNGLDGSELVEILKT